MGATSGAVRWLLGALAPLVALTLGSLVAGAMPALADPAVRVIVFGDSLAAGLGLAPEKAFPAQLEARLQADGYAVEVISSGVSGDTTAAGLERLDWAVPPEADAVIVELGANDALRGIDPKETARNLDRIVRALRARGLPVLVAGMRAPANWGGDYQSRFDNIFADVARRHGALLMPFFLEGVAMQPSLNQPDGIHPNAAGVARIVDGIVPYAQELIRQARGRRTSKS